MKMDVTEIFKLLEKKNSYLLEFHKLNNEEMERLVRGSVDNLENFYYSREILLNAIERLDKKFSKDQTQIQSIHSSHKKRLSDILDLKNRMVLSIVDQDITILSLMEKIEQGRVSA